MAGDNVILVCVDDKETVKDRDNRPPSWYRARSSEVRL
jgi:hypothetical protein